MLKLTVTMSESWNEEKQVFITEDVVLELEHSLVSMSKWESKYEKPFLGREDKTSEEVIDYIKMMISTPDYSPEVFENLTKAHIEEINAYIEAKMTATWFKEPPNKPRQERITTSEIVYYWMTSYQIPWEAQHWHLNRLFTLIKVFNEENNKDPKNRPKRSPAEIAAERRALNEKRRQQHNTKG